MAELTLDTFKSYIQHFFIKYPNVDERKIYIENLINTHYPHIKNECNEYMELKLKEGVHRTRCCIKHGCKHGGDAHCSVVSGEIRQDYLCEECGNEGITQLSQLFYDTTDNMDVERVDAKGNSCNFCSRGLIDHNGANLIFPYSHTTAVSSKGSGVSVRMCDECIKELIEKTTNN